MVPPSGHYVTVHATLEIKDTEVFGGWNMINIYHLKRIQYRHTTKIQHKHNKQRKAYIHDCFPLAVHKTT